jgi:hypothetical protein
MHRAIVKAGVLLFGILVFGILAASSAARADGECVSPVRTQEKMQSDSAGFDKLDGNQVKSLNKGFAAAYPGSHLVDADEALVFHHAEDPRTAWLVLFKNGCAVRQGYLDEDVYRSSLGLPPRTPSQPEPEVGRGNAGH